MDRRTGNKVVIPDIRAKMLKESWVDTRKSEDLETPERGFIFEV